MLVATLSSRATAQEGEPAPPATGGSESPAKPPQPDRWLPEFGRDDFQGYVWSRYRYRRTYHESDQDFLQEILLDVGQPDKDRITFSFLGEWSYDIDGRSNPSAFSSIEDTFDERLNGRLLHAYADLHRLDVLDSVRIGRQEWSAIPEVAVFDGVSAKTQAFTSWNLRFNALGGIPTHLYESSPSGDYVAGAGAEIEPTTGTWAALNFAAIRDELVLSDERDNFLTFELRQRIAREFQFGSRVTGLDGNVRDFNLRVSYAGRDNGWSGQISYFNLLKTQRQQVTELDPFFPVLEEEHPYQEGRLLLSKDIGERWTVDGGIWVRQLLDEGDEGTFNHEFVRYFITPTLHDWPLDELDLSVTGEIWDADQQTVATYGFDATKKLEKDLRISAGSQYAMFKYDPLLGDDREGVTTLYLRGRYDFTSVIEGDLALEWETDNQDTYQVMTAGLRWRF